MGCNNAAYDGDVDFSDELWIFSTMRMEWTLSPAGGESPSARYGHTMTAVENSLYLFGGFTDEGESSCDRCCD